MQSKSIWIVCGLFLLACGKSPEAPPAEQAARWSGEEYAGYRAENMDSADRALAEKVHKRLLQHPYLHATELRVVAQRGNVELSGRVGSDFERKIAEQVAAQVPGVKRVENELGMMVAPRQDPDESLRRELSASLGRAAPGSKIQARVKDGVVTLTGSLTDWDVYDDVMQAVYRAGPKSVENELEVTTRAPDEFMEFETPAEQKTAAPPDER